ncbi:MAG: heavy metal translocating P-type ATPase, partial [Minisyncoccia bacterium]
MNKKLIFNLDFFLFIILALNLILHFLNFLPKNIDLIILITLNIIATLPVVLSAIKSLKDKKVSVDLLAGIALIASLLSKEWLSAIFINLMLVSARIFSAYTDAKSKNAIQSLLKLKPKKVKIKKENNIIEEPVEKLKVNDLIIIEAGERIPADGIIEKGQAEIDQSSLTGESIPVFKKEKDQVLSSTLLISGTIMVRVLKIGQDTTFSKIIQLVENSIKNKSEITTLTDKFASWYITLTLIISVLIYIFSKNLNLVLSILLVTCADDIAVAIPMGFYAAVGAAAKKGIIIKGSNFLEGIKKVKILLLDKTGTLTKGQLKIQYIIPFENYDQKDVLKYAAIGDFFSEHPIAKTILAEAKKQKIEIKKPEKFNEIPGEGFKSTYKNKQIIIGKITFLEKNKILISKNQL